MTAKKLDSDRLGRTVIPISRMRKKSQEWGNLLTFGLLMIMIAGGIISITTVWFSWRLGAICMGLAWCAAIGLWALTR